jgi:hypothetical protein
MVATIASVCATAEQSPGPSGARTLCNERILGAKHEEVTGQPHRNTSRCRKHSQSAPLAWTALLPHPARSVGHLTSATAPLVPVAAQKLTGKRDRRSKVRPPLRVNGIEGPRSECLYG